IAALIAEAQARVQGDIRRAAAEEQQAGRSPGDFTARFEPQAELPTALIIQETDGDSVTLTTVTSAEQLTNLILTSAWRNRLFPPPADFANAVAAYLAELKTLLPGATFDDPSPPAANGAVTVQGSWKERALLPATNLRFHTQTGQLTPSAADVAPHFKSQIDALTAVSAAPDITVQLDRTYDAAVALIDSDSAARPISIDPDTDNVSITLPARLRDDPRPKASFQLSGALSERTLTGDAAARSAFAAYLKLLQQHQSTAGAQAARQALAIPAKLVAVLPTGFEGGNELALSVSDAAQHAIATIPLSWDVAQLTYVLSDQDAALTSIRAGVQKLLDVPSERRRLTQQLPAVLAAAGPAAPQTGAAYFTSCELVAFKPATDQPDDVFALAVEGEIGPPQSPQTEHLSLTLRLGFVDGLLSWDSEATAPAKLAVAEQLRALAGDAEFRKRRQDDVLQSLATSLKKPATELPPKVQDDALVVEVRGDDGRLTRYAAQWNNSTLRYDEPTAEVVAALSPAAAAEAKLADLTAGGGVAQLTADVFIDAFRDVTGAKIARCGQEAYQPLASLLDDGAAATARLAAVSTMLQDLIAPDRTKHPFPVVFVEYFLGPQDVYGLAWRAVTDDAGRITSATEPKIWRIMSTERLRQFGTPAVFRQAYSTDADLGEALLGQALGAALEGSDNNSYGVVLAPDGMLWYVYWEQVKFQSRPVSKLDGQGALVPTTATSLRDILKPGHKGSRPAWRRAGMWCVPTLAGQWQKVGRKRLNLGQLLPGKGDETASFSTTNDMLQCIIEDKSERSDLSWGELALRLRREDIGYLFWDRHWNGDRCNPTRIANFSLIPVKTE
ncbi:MAG: hypothetical protein KKB50_18470, partial [Planctomycetes bacterium]|nr:hypothetical protein [Planctomycetota bacterium]